MFDRYITSNGRITGTMKTGSQYTAVEKHASAQIKFLHRSPIPAYNDVIISRLNLGNCCLNAYVLVRQTPRYLVSVILADSV